MSRQPFEKLKFRIHNIPKGADLWAEFPELNRHVELNEIKERTTCANEVIRYLVYLYDPESDLIKEEQDLTSRMRRAKELSGIHENTDNDLLLDMGWVFISKIYHHRKMREWHTLQLELEENNRARWTQIDIDEEVEDKDGKTKTRSSSSQKNSMEVLQRKSELRKHALEIQKALDVLEPDIFGDNEDVKKKALERLLTNPEKIANAYK
jgi:hypothetical protein